MQDNSFRSAQAVGDLLHHVKPLLALHLVAVAEASGLTLAQTGKAFRALRDDGFRFQRDEVLPLLAGLETISEAKAEGIELAVVVLLADALQRGRVLAGMDWAARHLRDWPASLRSAVANGLVRAGELGLLRLEALPTTEDCLTRGVAEIAEALLRVARSMRRDELYAVAERGADLAQDFADLMEAIGQRDGIFAAGAAFDLIELGAQLPKQAGYEGCTAVLLLNALHLGDGRAWFASRWQEQGAVYCALQPSRRDAILAGIRYLYETDRGFLRDHAVQTASRLGGGAIIPVVEDL
jgi:hypothetical protein